MRPDGETATALGGILSGLGENKTPKPAARKAQPVDELGFPLAPSLQGKIVPPQKPKSAATNSTPVIAANAGTQNSGAVGLGSRLRGNDEVGGGSSSFVAEPEKPNAVSPLLKPLAQILRAALKLPPLTDEAISSTGRTVKAARKTSDHSGFADLHASAIRDFGDGALHEVAEFKDQLLEADPKAHDSWWNAFQEKAPDLADRFHVRASKNDRGGDKWTMELRPGEDKGGVDITLPNVNDDPNKGVMPMADNGSDAPAGSAGQGTLAGGAGDDKLSRLSYTPGDDDMSLDAPPLIPADKKYVFEGKEHEWQDFYDATGKLPNVSDTERAAYMHIFGREGGMKKDPAQGSTAASGIPQKTADAYLGRGDLSHVKPGTPPEKLSAEDRARIYRHYIDAEFPEIGGHKVLNQIGDQKAATALADGMIRLGHEDAAESIQKAMKSVDQNAPIIDGVFGSRSLSAYRRLVSDSKTRDRLLNATADEFTAKAPDEKSRWDALRP